MLPATTSSDETFEIAKFWLSDCVSHHDLCNRTTNSSARLPPRLLDIGLLETARIVRVVDTRGELVDKYVCLSHCWGTINMPFRSTSQNIKILNNGVLMSDLPQTFQDAVWVTHLLSFQYLWIDSLCILQDDVEDWKSHTTIMTDIYQNAHLVLAATWGRDSHSGLFRSNKHAGPLYMRKPLPHWWGQTSFGKNDYWHRAFVDELPLLERAWVFQERLLSKRILHFTPAELHFECREELKCQCTHGLRVYNSHPKARHSRVLQEGGAREIGIRWRAIVTEYSKLDLSFATDRLPALLGIAKEIQAASPSRIIAGCWEKTLSDDLL
ncbi:heterokaryon incompatibility protein-domain-containing protein, partial [Lophiotrema nucula]